MRRFLLTLFLIFISFLPANSIEEKTQIQFVYINGSNNNDIKMKNWFYSGMEKMHKNMYKAFSSDDFIKEHLLRNGEYEIAQMPEAFFWGDKSSDDIEYMNYDLNMIKMFSPKMAQTIRTLLAHCLHDAIWVSHYRNMHSITNDLHKLVMRNYKNGKPVVLYGYSAGSFVTYEYFLNKFKGVDVAMYFNSTDANDDFKDYVKQNKKKDTCADALIASGIAVYSAEGKLVLRISGEKLKEKYNELDSYTCSSCMPDGAVIGVVNFASPISLFYSDSANPKFDYTLFNKYLYKYILEKNIFFLTVNYADDPLGYPSIENAPYDEMKEYIDIDVKPNGGFIFSKNDIKSRRTVLGAHTSYWETSKKFSKAVVKAYKDGYELYNK